MIVLLLLTRHWLAGRSRCDHEQNLNNFKQHYGTHFNHVLSPHRSNINERLWAMTKEAGRSSFVGVSSTAGLFRFLSQFTIALSPSLSLAHPSKRLVDESERYLIESSFLW